MKMLYIPIISDIGKAFIALLMVLDSWVYEFISSSYRVFMALSGARLLSSDAFSTIANKLYIIVGVVMLFVLSYAIIKAIIDPDQMTKGDLGGPKIIKGVLIAVIGLGITPVLFNMLYQAQGVILENNVLGELFFRSGSYTVDLQDTTYVDKDGNEIKIEYNEDTINPDDILKSSGGALVATHIWQAFFYPASGNLEDAKNIESAAADYLNNNFGTAVTCGVVAGAATGIGLALAGFTGGISLLIAGAAAIAGATCYNVSDALDEAYASVIENGKITLEQAYVMSASQGDFGIYTTFLDEVSGDDATIDYVMVLSTIVGGVVLYAFISFSIDMGVRCAKLAYYQIIAPIPLILQVLPKFKDSFNKYVKGVLSTFLEVFIRISVVYVMVYIVCHITDLFSTSGVWADLGPIEGLFARVLLDVGLVIFAKQAPKLIQETFGIQSGSMSLGIGKKLADGGLLAAGAILGGTARQMATNARTQWGRDKGINGGKRVARAFGSGFTGGLGAFYRSTKDQISKPAGSFSDMKDQINKTWDAGNAAKKKRDDHKDDVAKRAKELADAAGKPVSSLHYARARAELKGKKIADKVDLITGATIDTSRDDRTISLYQSGMDERDKLRTKTGKVKDTRFVTKMLESLQSEKVEYFNQAGYDAAVKLAAESVGPRSAYASDADYQNAIDAAVRSVDKNRFINQNYEADVSSLQKRTNGINKLLEAVQDLNSLGLMEKGDGALQAEFQNYITANWNDLKDRLDDEVVLDNGVTTTMREMLKNVGVNTSTGVVDFSSSSSLYSNRVIEIERIDQNGHKTKEYQRVVTDPNSGEITEVIQVDANGVDILDAAGNIISMSLERLTERIKNDSDVSNVSAKTAINTFNDACKEGKNNMLTSEKYIRTQQRKLDQQNKKNGNK